MGTLTIERFHAGEPLPGGQVDIETTLGIYSVTDGADGEEDGQTILSGLASGSYLVREVPPPDYAAARPMRVKVRPGRNDVRLDTSLLATVTVERIDASGASLAGGELSLRNAAEAVVARALGVNAAPGGGPDSGDASPLPLKLDEHVAKRYIAFVTDISDQQWVSLHIRMSRRTANAGQPFVPSPQFVD